MYFIYKNTYKTKLNLLIIYHKNSTLNCAVISKYFNKNIEIHKALKYVYCTNEEIKQYIHIYI